jgi:hypothetical protein
MRKLPTVRRIAIPTTAIPPSLVRVSSLSELELELDEEKLKMPYITGRAKSIM